MRVSYYNAKEKNEFVVNNNAYNRYFENSSPSDRIKIEGEFTPVIWGSIKSVLYSGEYLSDSLKHEFSRAKSILELPANWDGDGSPSFEQKVLERAILLVKNHAKWLYENFQIMIDIPTILPGPEGSIDIHWQGNKYELLVNVPRKDNQPATFYGDNYGSSSIKGSFVASDINQGFLQLWKI